MRNLNALLLLAVALIILWVVAGITRFLAGAALHFLLIISLILFAVLAIQRIRA